MTEPFIPYGRQNISEADIEAVVDVLRSDYITQGPAIERFEQAVATHCGSKYAVAVSNATAGLHIACMAAGLCEGKTLWTSPNTFVASANAGLYCGANVDFVDIDPKTYNLSAEALKVKLEKGAAPDVLIPVHFAGQSSDMQAIAALAKKYNFAVIEDAAHAIGATYQGKPVGDCRHSDMTVFSFHPVKIITTGEGGVITTNRKDLYEILIRLRTHGITRNADLMKANHGPWYYEQLELGFNYRMTDIQAALGASQMTRLKEFVEKRQKLAARYDELLGDLPLTRPWKHPDTASSWHLYVIRLQDTARHKETFEALRKANIGVNLHYIPVHLQPYYQQLGFKMGDFPEAEAYYESAITLPLFDALTEKQQDYIAATLKQILCGVLK